MDYIFIIALTVLAFLGLPVGIAYLLYFVPRKVGHPKAGKYLAIAFGTVVLVGTLWIVFEDQLFTRGNVKDLLQEQQIVLMDDFNIQDNHSSFAIGDYYHTFTLAISSRDRKRVIAKIKSSPGFKRNTSEIDSPLYLRQDRYMGPKIVQNFETEDSYVRAYFQPSGKKGYAPTYRRIFVSKTENKLTFEDIDE